MPPGGQEAAAERSDFRCGSELLRLQTIGQRTDQHRAGCLAFSPGEVVKRCSSRWRALGSMPCRSADFEILRLHGQVRLRFQNDADTRSVW
jgi:hypothetical protein